MINTYLLTMEEVEALVLSLDKYYSISFTNLGKSAGVSVNQATDVCKKLLKMLAKTPMFHNFGDDLAKFLQANESGLTKFAKYWDILFSDTTLPTLRLVDFNVKVAHNDIDYKYIKFGHGINKSKCWGYVLKPYILDGSLFDKRDEGAALRYHYERHVYEMLLDYIYFCLVNSERVVSRDMDYEGIEVVEGFDVSIVKMFLEYYEKMKGNAVKLISSKDEPYGRFQFFKEGIRDYCRNCRGHLVEDYVRDYYFQREFFDANWYGIQEMLKLDRKAGAKEEKFLREMLYGKCKNKSEHKRGRVLGVIVRFVDYVLSGCYI